VLQIRIVLKRIRIQLFIKKKADPDPHQSEGNFRPLVYRSPPGLHFEHPGIYYERSRLYFEPLLNFYFNADENLDPAFQLLKKCGSISLQKNLNDSKQETKQRRRSTLLLKHKRKRKKRSYFTIWMVFSNEKWLYSRTDGWRRESPLPFDECRCPGSQHSH
jgi:hypothetical protein